MPCCIYRPDDIDLRSEFLGEKMVSSLKNTNRKAHDCV